MYFERTNTSNKQRDEIDRLQHIEGVTVRPAELFLTASSLISVSSTWLH